MPRIFKASFAFLVVTAPTFAQQISAHLLGGREGVLGEKTFCVDIKLSSNPKPLTELSVLFVENTKGYMEVDGNRVKSWVADGHIGSAVAYFFYPDHSGLYRLTLGVLSPENAKVEDFEISSSSLSSIKEVPCPSTPPKKAASASKSTSSGIKSSSAPQSKSPSWPVYSQSELDQCRKHLSNDGGGADKDSPVHQRCVAVTCTDQIRRDGGYNGSPVHQLCVAEIAKQTAK